MAEYQRHNALMPPKGKDLRRHRKEFTRFQKLRELDWREAFQRGVAEDLRVRRKAERLEAEAKRQEAWRQYRDALFERAQLAGGDAEMLASPTVEIATAAPAAAAAAAEPTARSS